MYGLEHCGFKTQSCFQLKVKQNVTILQAYNCDKTKPGEKRQDPDPAEKQIFRPDYVRHHFVHYTLVSETSVLNKDDTEKLGLRWTYNTDDLLARYVNESAEALMLHAKAIAPHETNLWEKACSGTFKGWYACRLGNPFPRYWNGTISDENGIKYNCHLNYKVEDYFLKLLKRDLKKLSSGWVKDLIGEIA
jgi:hypothetical protein